MVIGRRVDEYISSNLTELRATAIDAFVDGDFLVAAGCRYTTFLSIGSPSISINRYINNRNIVRLVRCNANQSRVYALASAQEIEVCKLDEEFGNKSLATLCGHSRSVLDLSWNPFNDNMLASSSEGDSVNFWDIRDSAKPVSELNTQFGASQAKFSPKMEYIVCTAHGSDIRVWDIRKPNYPWNQYICYDGKIHALEWHPKEPNCFITSHYDGIVKIWDSNETSRTPTAVTINAWKIVFSPDAEEFATISLPSNNDMSNSVNIWRLSNFENCLTVKNDESDVIVDACWQNTNRKGVKYLFTLSKKRRLYRHPIIYEMMNEGRDEMPTPIAQSEVDVERDRLAMEPRIDEQEAFEINDLVLDHITDGPRIFQPSNRYHIPSESLPTSQLSRLVSGGNTPLIISEWQRWITAPNATGGDLLTVLEALRKHNTEGLYTTEINFQRAAIGFSYEHWAKCKKLKIEMRFHHSYLENGKVFVEVVQKDCPLTSDKAALFLQLLQTEADIQKRVPSSTTILARVLQQIPKLVESMQVFTASMDVPNAQKFSGNLSSSSEDKVSKNNSETNQTDPTVGSQKEEATANFILSPYDEFVPAPRTAGCRFNGSGFLVTFGRIHSTVLPRSLRLNKTSIGDNMYGSSRKISFHTNETNVTDVPTVPTSRHRKLHSGKGSTHSAIAEAKRESYRSYAEFVINHKPIPQSTAHGTKRDVVSQNAERYSISGGSPQSGFGYMTTVSSTTNMSNVYQRANPIKSSTKVLGTSPSPSIPSGTSRSYSLQNVNQSLRHRGSSISGVAGEEGSVIAEPMYSSLVTVYDATGLLPISKELASKYKLLGSSALELCQHNRKAVQESNRKDLLIVWKLLEQCIQTAMKSENNETLSCINQCPMVESTNHRKSSAYSHNPFKTAWSHHPFGRGLVNSLLDHYSKLCDLQTAAVITCILGQHVHKSSPTSSRLPHSASNPFQAISTETPTFERATTSPSNVSQGGLILKEIPSSNPESVLRKTVNELKLMQLKIPRTSSYGSDVGNVSSSGGDEHNFPPRKISPSTLSTTTTYSAHETLNNSDSSATLTYADGIEAASKHSSKDKSESYELNKNDYLLDPALATRFEDVRLQYADILYRWRMYSKCTEVLKYCSSDTGIEQIDEVCFCVKCGQSLRNMKKCDKCKNPPITCAICDLPCRGATVTCPGCSHGGHLSHMTAWFQNQRACPLACGCDCKF